MNVTINKKTQKSITGEGKYLYAVSINYIEDDFNDGGAITFERSDKSEDEFWQDRLNTLIEKYGGDEDSWYIVTELIGEATK
jgi:hypothetical protein